MSGKIMELRQLGNSDMFWYWINERHQVYLRSKVKHESKPWTHDPILQTYKFTNVFRQLDTGTVWLTQNFLTPHKYDDLELIAFNICWYRMFNWIGTGARIGWKKSWEKQDIINLLTRASKEGKQIFTGAHIIHSEPGEPKIDSIVDVCSHIFESRRDIVKIAKGTNSLEDTFKELKKHRHVGSFLAYEMVSDMRWTRLLEDACDINTWANPGPGAMRGLYRIGLPSTEKTGVASMRELLSQQYSQKKILLGDDTGTENFKEPWVPELEMRDIEHSLCEFDKYARVKFGEGRPRGRYEGK